MDKIASLPPFDWSDDQKNDGLVTKHKVIKDMVNIENSAVYQGEWLSESNVREGRGVMIFKNGIRYDGFFADGKA